MRNSMRFRNRLITFMYGRYGFDALSVAFIWFAALLAIINIFVHSIIIALLQSGVLFIGIFRALSRNIYKRRRENAVYTSVCNRVKGFFGLQRNRFRDRKTHIYRRCPHCKANLRLPKRKGKHKVRCPRCAFRFDVKC